MHISSQVLSFTPRIDSLPSSPPSPLFRRHAAFFATQSLIVVIAEQCGRG